MAPGKSLTVRAMNRLVELGIGLTLSFVVAQTYGLASTAAQAPASGDLDPDAKRPGPVTSVQGSAGPDGYTAGGKIVQPLLGGGKQPSGSSGSAAKAGDSVQTPPHDGAPDAPGSGSVRTVRTAAPTPRPETVGPAGEAWASDTAQGKVDSEWRVDQRWGEDSE